MIQCSAANVTARGEIKVIHSLQLHKYSRNDHPTFSLNFIRLSFYFIRKLLFTWMGLILASARYFSHTEREIRLGFSFYRQRESFLF